MTVFVVFEGGHCDIVDMYLYEGLAEKRVLELNREAVNDPYWYDEYDVKEEL